MRYTVFDTAWGNFGFVTRGKCLVATFLPQAEGRLRREIQVAWPQALETDNELPRFRRQVVDYFRGRPIAFSVEIDWRDMPVFRRAVLRQCRRISYGDTVSYQDLARAAGRPRAVRAVGGAMARNPLPLVVPCHRVLRADGSLGGFSSPGGIKLKERLLRLENAFGEAPLAGR